MTGFILNIVRWSNIALAILFFLAATVQFNDPDPIQWAAVYFLSGVICGFSCFVRLPRIIPVLLGGVVFFWAGTISLAVFDYVLLTDLFLNAQMLNLAVEEAREIIGLVLIGIWMVVLVILPVNFERKSNDRIHYK